jgi:hypothetical protein
MVIMMIMISLLIQVSPHSILKLQAALTEEGEQEEGEQEEGEGEDMRRIKKKSMNERKEEDNMIR